MAKPEWGVKRACLSCGTRFYDMQKDPIVCPSCGANFDVESIFRPRRARATAEEPPAKEKTSSSTNGEDIDDELAALTDDDIVDDDDDEDDSALEDTSDLADDDSDVPIVRKDMDEDSS